MRGRLLAGPTALADYEIVEMLLFLGIPRRDTKPLAKGLILRFGGLREVVTASGAALIDAGVPPRVVEAFGMVVDAAEQLAQADRSEPLVLRDRAAVGRYLVDSARPLRTGWSVVLLGSRNQLLGDLACDGANAGAVASTVLRHALGRHATAAILVRGATGVPEVLDSDVLVFTGVQTRAAPLAVVLHDLVVVGSARRWVSLSGAA